MREVFETHRDAISWALGLFSSAPRISEIFEVIDWSYDEGYLTNEERKELYRFAQSINTCKTCRHVISGEKRTWKCSIKNRSGVSICMANGTVPKWCPGWERKYE